MRQRLNAYTKYIPYISDVTYRISSVTRQSFFVYFLQKNNPKNLDQSYKTDLDLWDCFAIISNFYRTDLVICSHSRKRNTPSYSQINTEYLMQMIDI